MKGRSLSGYQRKRVWINDGARPVHRRRAGRRRHRRLRRPRGRARRSLQPRRARRHRREPARTAAHLQEHRAAGAALDRRSSSRARASNRSAIGARVELQWDGQHAGAGGQRRQRLQRAESAPAALRPGRGDGRRPRRDPLAVRPAADDRQPAIDQLHRVREPHDVRERDARRPARMARPRFTFSLENRLLPPILITCILDRRAPLVRHPRELHAHRRWRSSRRSRPSSLMGAADVRPVAASGERLHHRHQRRHPGPVAVSVAVCAVPA